MPKGRRRIPSAKRVTELRDAKSRVQETLYQHGSEQNRAETRDLVRHIVVPDLTAHGHFYRDRDRYYYLDRDAGRLMAIEPGDPALELLLHKRFGILPRDTIGRDLIDILGLHAEGEGTLTTIHRLAHYHLVGNEIYLFDHDHTVRVITATDVHGMPHGSHNVLFARQTHHEPYSLVALPADLDPAPELLDVLTRGVPYRRRKNPAR